MRAHHLVLNFVGGTIRWIYGSLWRTIFNKPKFTFNEYLYGPKKSEDYFDKTAHKFNNIIIGLIAIGIIFSLIIKYS